MVGPCGNFLTGARKGNEPLYNNMIGTLKSFREEGVLFRGSTGLVIRGATVTAGLQLGYDGFRTHIKENNLMTDGPILHCISATFGGFLGALFCAPADVIMTKYQSGPSMGKNYTSYT